MKILKYMQFFLKKILICVSFQTYKNCTLKMLFIILNFNESFVN